MRAVIQRVKHCSVKVEDKMTGTIDDGLFVLLGIEEADTDEDIQWLSNKVINLRIFNDESNVMNKSMMDLDYDILIVSQFTLFASTKKGNRPSYLRSAKPDISKPMYERFVQVVSTKIEKPVQTGIFGADMKVTLLNDGPVTITIDSKNRE